MNNGINLGELRRRGMENLMQGNPAQTISKNTLNELTKKGRKKIIAKAIKAKKKSKKLEIVEGDVIKKINKTLKELIAFEKEIIKRRNFIAEINSRNSIDKEEINSKLMTEEEIRNLSEYTQELTEKINGLFKTLNQVSKEDVKELKKVA